MEPAADDSPIETPPLAAPIKTLPRSVHVWLWIFLGAWVISFFLPAVDIWGKTGRGWEVAWDALVLSFVPVKGAWLIFLPQIWLVWVNPFMLLAPFEIKRVGRGQGRFFSVLFLLATVLPIAVAYIFSSHNHSHDLVTRFRVGFYLWEFSSIASAALFVRILWRNWLARLPAACLMGLLLAVPLYRGEVDFLPLPLTNALGTKPGEVPQILTTIRLVASSPNPSLMGEPVTFTAAISATGDAPTGTVEFVEGRALIGKVHTTAGVATLSTNALKTGEHFITANFTGDVATHYIGSNSQGLTQIVNDPKDSATRTVLTLVEQHPGQPADQIGFTLRAKVTAMGSTAPVASGDVLLKFMYGFRTAVKLDDEGKATFSSVLPAAVWRGYEVEAIYNGGGGFQASMSTLTLQ